MELQVVADWLDEHGKMPTVAAMFREVSEREPRPFPTGSRVYGTPRADSDYDVVVLFKDGELAYLAERIKERGVSANRKNLSLRIDAWNLVCFTLPLEYEAWRLATEELEKRKPVTKDEAIVAIAAECARLKVPGHGVEAEESLATY